MIKLSVMFIFCMVEIELPSFLQFQASSYHPFLSRWVLGYFTVKMFPKSRIYVVREIILL